MTPARWYRTGYRTRLPSFVSVTARRLWIPLALVALAAVLAIGLSQAGGGAGPPRAERLTLAQMRARLAGAPAPLAALHARASAFLPGGERGLLAELRRLRGHPAVVNVWAAWCGPCREELPVFQRAALARGRQVAFLGVDIKDNRESAVRLLRQIPLPYPSVDDPDGQVYNAYGLFGTPSTAFYDSAGRRTFLHQGPYRTVADLERDIDRYATPSGLRPGGPGSGDHMAAFATPYATPSGPGPGGPGSGDGHRPRSGWSAAFATPWA
jgi:cytochrome c biogenesis protein CcmG/thiol:disulfide interchange protein DsbE